MRKQTVFAFVLFAAAILTAALLRVASRNCAKTAAAVGDTVVVLDAGHGGEDGGAVADDGTNEKDINLRMTKRIALFFDLFGVPYLSVREDDRLIGDSALPTVRERKVSDIHARMDLVTGTPGAILLSIHQNFFVREQFSGTQVFYAPNAPGSDAMAAAVQSAVVRLLQPDNTRQVKPTEGTVYLLDKAVNTSVMVECGFLSNGRELALLKDPTYQTKLSYCIVRGVCDYINNQKIV